MTTTGSSLKKGQRVPDWVVTDHAGKKHTLWDYRQKSHVALLYDPASKRETIRHWVSAIEADRNQWAWLNVKVIVVAEGPKGLEPGVYTIDRYGMFLNAFPAERWTFDDLEREFLYYEARHC